MERSAIPFRIRALVNSHSTIGNEAAHWLIAEASQFATTANPGNVACVRSYEYLTTLVTTTHTPYPLRIPTSMIRNMRAAIEQRICVSEWYHNMAVRMGVQGDAAERLSTMNTSLMCWRRSRRSWRRMMLSRKRSQTEKGGSRANVHKDHLIEDCNVPMKAVASNASRST